MTMKTFRFITGLALSIMLTGCVITVNPVIRESEAIFDADALLSALQSGKVRLPYRHSKEVTANTDDEALIISGTTEELRNSLGKHCANPAVFERDWMNLRRMSAGSGLPASVP